MEKTSVFTGFDLFFLTNLRKIWILFGFWLLSPPVARQVIKLLGFYWNHQGLVGINGI